MLGDDRLLRPALRVGRELLPLASAAGRKRRTAGQYAVRPRSLDGDGTGAEPVAPPLDDVGDDSIAGDDVRDEDDLALVPGDGVDAVAHALDVEGQAHVSRRPARR